MQKLKNEEHVRWRHWAVDVRSSNKSTKGASNIFGLVNKIADWGVDVRSADKTAKKVSKIFGLVNKILMFVLPIELPKVSILQPLLMM